MIIDNNKIKQLQQHMWYKVLTPLPRKTDYSILEKKLNNNDYANNNNTKIWLCLMTSIDDIGSYCRNLEDLSIINARASLTKSLQSTKPFHKLKLGNSEEDRYF